MKRVRAALVFVLGVTLAGCQARSANSQPVSQGQGPLCAVYFSPHGGCTQEVVQALREAKERVLVQAYSFTSRPIAQALVEACRRGVKVEVILDNSQRTERHAAADILRRAGIPVDVDARHAIAHNKVIVIDGRIVLTGSFNFTEAAEERNAENLLVVRDTNLAEQYASNWRAHRAHSFPFEE